MKPRVLVTDGEQRSTLAVVRSLGRAGMHVEVCATTPRPLAGASRSCRAEHLVPDPASDGEAYRVAVAELLDRGGFEWLIPMTDAAATVLLALRDTHPAVTIPFPHEETYLAGSDKAQLAAAAADLGVPVPRQVVVGWEDRASAGLHASVEELGGPVVLKPHRSAVLVGGRVQRFGVRPVGSVDEAMSHLAAMPEAAFPVLVQERIDGDGLGGFFLASGGRILAHFAHRRIREKPPTGGVSVLRESVALRDDVRAFSEALLGHLGWSGVAMVEFKEDRASGTPYLMEINGRFWGSLQLAVDAGVDFPRLLLDRWEAQRDVETLPALPEYRLGVRSRWLWGDVDHLMWMLRRGRTPQARVAGLPGPLAALGSFLRPGGRRTRLEVLRWGDTGPFWRESRLWFRSLSG